MEFEEKALHRKNILVTRPEQQAFEFGSKLIQEGANIYLLPTVKILPPENYDTVDHSLRNIKSYTWILFTSANGVRYFLERLTILGLGIDYLSGIKIAAVGPSTANLLEKEGIKVNFIPSQYTAESLGLEIEGVAFTNILIPSTDITQNRLKEILEIKGAIVDSIAFYYTRKNEVANSYIETTFNAGIDVITFTSSSAIQSLIALTEPLRIDLNQYPIACIGPFTAETAREHGLRVDIIGNPYTLEGLISEIVHYYENKEVKKA